MNFNDCRAESKINKCGTNILTLTKVRLAKTEMGIRHSVTVMMTEPSGR